MRQLTFVEAGRVEWQAVPEAELADPAGALVCPLAVARCDIDLPMAAAGLFPGPFPVGHVPAAALATLPDNAVDGYRAVGPLRQHPGAEVLIVGGGVPSVPLYAVAFAVALGAARVRYVDSDASRVDAARALGAAAELREGPWPRRFDPAFITVDATGDADGLAAVLRSTEDYGLCTSVAIYFGAATRVPRLEMYTKGRDLPCLASRLATAPARGAPAGGRRSRRSAGGADHHRAVGGRAARLARAGHEARPRPVTRGRAPRGQRDGQPS
jgi:hypothetical protein